MGMQQRSAWCGLFPYLGEKQIRNAIERLLMAKLIARDQFSAGNVSARIGIAWRKAPNSLAERAKRSAEKSKRLLLQTQIHIRIPLLSPPNQESPRRGSTSAIRLEEFLRNSATLPPGQTNNSDGTSVVSATSGPTSPTTGPAEMPSTAVARQTGRQPGALTVAAPRTAAKAEQLAVALTTDLLPPSVQSWLAVMEQHQLWRCRYGASTRRKCRH